MANNTQRVHFNLQTHLWSITVRGIVVDSQPEYCLTNVTFIVSQAGWKRAMHKLHKRTVHAWAQGEQGVLPASLPSGIVEVHYNPHRASTFTLRDGTPIY